MSKLRKENPPVVQHTKGKWFLLEAGLTEAQESSLSLLGSPLWAGRSHRYGRTRTKGSGESLEILKFQQGRAFSSFKATEMDLPQKKRLLAACWEQN